MKADEAGSWTYKFTDLPKYEAGEEIVFSTKFEEDIIALKTAEGTVLPFQMLSDGYRNVIKIMLDIATRMCILNPYLKEKVEWGMVPYVQAMLLARYLRGDLDGYPVFLWK